MPDFIPRRDSEFKMFCGTFSRVLGADPARFGRTVAEAQGYAALYDVFDEAYRRTVDPGTRTPTQLVKKDGARAALTARTRQLATSIRADPAVEDAALGELGLSRRGKAVRRVGRPTEMPEVRVVSTAGHRVRLRLHGGGRPRGALAMAVYTFVGDRPPGDIGAWPLHGNTSRRETDVDLPLALTPGTVVWFTGAWLSPTCQAGPAGPPAMTQVGFGGTPTLFQRAG